ncbi:glycosyl transferase [Lewinellaceae bacterium SD302]|nr:glycosyl transferase [Lewinellaceae bacterium SD302]
MQICQHNNTEIKAPNLLYPLILLLVTFFYWVGTGNIHLFDWDEINFAEISREMIVSGNFWQPTIDFLPFHEKPPLFSWFQAFSFQLFGIDEMAARLPNVLCGGFTLGSLYLVGRRWHSPALGLWWTAFMAFSILPQLYFRSGIIDPWFNLFIFLSLATLLPAGTQGAPNPGRITVAGLLLGLAVLTKGPVAALLVGLTLGIWLLLRRPLFKTHWWRFLLVGLLSLLPIGLWIAYVWQLDDGFFAREFIRYQWRLFISEDAGHGGFPGYHVVVLLFGCFPASIFALPELLNRKTSRAATSILWPKILFWVVLILFSIVNTKIVHYSSLAYFPLTFLAARRAVDLLNEPRALISWAHRTGQIIWGLFALILICLPLAFTYLLPELEIKDMDLQSSIAYGKPELSGYWAIGLPLLILLYLLTNWQKRQQTLRYLIGQLSGATYLVVVVLLFYVGQVQRVTQGANVDFFTDLAERKEVYYGMAYRKSYVPLFYGKVRPANGGIARDHRFHGAIDRDLYFASPLRRTEQVLKEVPDAELLYSKGGFSFYRRPAIEPLE